MSWSISAIGTPENLSKALDAESEKLSGDSKAEFDQARPNIQGLLAMNVNDNYPSVLHLRASGHASKSNGQVTYSTCNVSLQVLDGRLV